MQCAGMVGVSQSALSQWFLGGGRLSKDGERRIDDKVAALLSTASAGGNMAGGGAGSGSMAGG
eukprot:1855023-Prymnesium_polylepis.1